MCQDSGFYRSGGPEFPSFLEHEQSLLSGLVSSVAENSQESSRRDKGSALPRARLPSPPHGHAFQPTQKIALPAHCGAFFEFACFVVVAGFCFVL